MPSQRRISIAHRWRINGVEHEIAGPPGEFLEGVALAMGTLGFAVGRILVLSSTNIGTGSGGVREGALELMQPSDMGTSLAEKFFCAVKIPGPEGWEANG